MAYVVPTVVALLMVSIGMSLSLVELWASLRRLTWLAWVRMLLATFILPAFLALFLGRLFRLDLGELAGIFLVGVAPGAPLLTRNLARKGFDMHLAATYQVWAAAMIPIMIPVIVFCAARLYDRDVWVPPAILLRQIVIKQFLPLGLGMLIARAAPASRRLQPTLNMLGNIALIIILVLVLFKLGPALKEITPTLPIVSLLLALGCVSAVWIIRLRDPVVNQTFAVSNANRHAGLALLLSGQYVHAAHALPAIACYALLAPLVMLAFARWYGAGSRMQPGALTEPDKQPTVTG